VNSPRTWFDIVEAEETLMSTKKFNKQKKNRDQTHVPASLIVYNGPVTSGKASSGVETLEVSLRASSTVTMTTGVVTDVFTNEPSASADWASFIAAWSEFRVLAMQVDYEPNSGFYADAHADDLFGELIVVNDHTSTLTALASYATAIAYSSAKLKSLIKRFTAVWKMSGTEEAQFQLVGSPAATGSIKLYGEAHNGTPTAIRGFVVVTYLVQFRARK
jgi:hypothetical protein